MIWDTTKYFLTYDLFFREIYVKQIKISRLDFSKIVEDASKKNYKNIDWWVSPIGERNNYTTKLFHYICLINSIKYIYSKKISVKKIIVDNKSLYLILKKNFPKYNFVLAKEKNYFNFLKIIFKHTLVFFVSNLFKNKDKLKNLTKKTILIDKFISSTDLTEDRYYSNFFEKKKNAIYFPTIVNLGLFQLIKTLIHIQKSKKYLNKFDLLNLNDFIFSILYLIRRKKLYVKRIFFKKIDISEIINDEIIKNYNINASIIGIQNFLFTKRLAEKKITFKKFINWFENTAVDKGLNLGFNSFLKNIELIGYQGFTSYKEFICLDPVDFEKKYKLLPHKIVCTGKNLIEPKKEFSKKINVILGPALRFDYIFNKKIFKKKYSNSVLINLNLEEQNSLLMIENVMKTDFYKKYEGKIYLKVHPLMDIRILKKYINMKNVFFIKGRIFDLASKFNLTVTSGPSSSIMETIVAGCNVCFPFDNFTDAYSLKLMNVPKSCYKVCSNIEELNNHLIELTKKTTQKIMLNANLKLKIFNKKTKLNQSILY